MRAHRQVDRRRTRTMKKVGSSHSLERERERERESARERERGLFVPTSVLKFETKSHFMNSPPSDSSDGHSNGSSSNGSRMDGRFFWCEFSLSSLSLSLSVFRDYIDV